MEHLETVPNWDNFFIFLHFSIEFIFFDIVYSKLMCYSEEEMPRVAKDKVEKI